MALLTIREIGDPILNKKAKEVKESSDRLQELIDDMFETMYEANGVGLAAPQGGILKRLGDGTAPCGDGRQCGAGSAACVHQSVHCGNVRGADRI